MRLFNILTAVLALFWCGLAVAQDESSDDQTSQQVSEAAEQVQLINAEPLSEDDLSFQTFRLVLGDAVHPWVNKPTQGPRSLMGDLWNYLNSSLLVVAAAVAGVITMGWFLRSAHIARINPNETTIPLRLVLVMAFLVPLSTGYSGIQHLFLHGIEVSTKTANHLSDLVFERWVSGETASSVTIPHQGDLVGALFQMQMCTAGVNAVEGERGLIRPKTIQPSQKLDGNGNILSIKPGGIQFGDHDSMLFGYSEAACGEVLFNFPEIDPRVTDGHAERAYFSAVSDSTIEVIERVYEPVKSIYNLVLYPKTAKNCIDNAAQCQPVYENVESILDDIRQDFERELAEASRQYSLDRSSYLSTQTAEPSFLTYFPAGDLGWMAIGGTWWQQSMRQSRYQSMLNELVPEVSTSVDTDVLELEDLDLYWQAGYKASGGRMTLGRGTDMVRAENFLETHIREEKSIIIENMMDLLRSESDPLYAMMQLGHRQILLAEVLLGLRIAIEGTEQWLDAAQKTDGSLLEQTITAFDFGRSKQLLMAMAEAAAAQTSFLMGLAIAALMAMGAYLAFYLPALPILHWLGVILGTLVALFESFFLLPVFLVASVMPGGVRILYQGLGLALSSLLRAPLAVIWFVFALGLVLAIGKITMLVLEPFLQGMNSDSIFGVVSLFATMGVAIMVITTTIEKSFSMSVGLLDKTMQILGAGSGYGAMQPNDQFKVVDRTVNQLGGGAGSPVSTVNEMNQSSGGSGNASSSGSSPSPSNSRHS